MPTTVNLRRILDRKSWEVVAPLVSATTAGMYFVSTPTNWPVPMVLWVRSGASQLLYNIAEDAWIAIPQGTLGNPANGSCGTFHPYGPSFTASAGSTTTATSTLTLPGSLAGYTMRCTAGTGIGQNVTIVSNTYGASAVFTFAAVSTGFDNTSVFQVMSGRFWVLVATGAAVVWKYYDVATNTWTAKSTTSGPASGWATDGCAVATAGLCCTSAVGGVAGAIASGTATSGSGTTLANSGKAWATNQWANFQVRITAGTGLGQIRVINSNTATALTVSASWTTTPDATSVYAIEGCDDWVWVIGNGVVTMLRYAINGTAGLSANAQATGDTWITVAPGGARGGATSAGISLNWVSDSTDATMTIENAILNGRRFYSFRGGNQNFLDAYDIPSNTWAIGPITFGRQNVTQTTGWSFNDHKGIIYMHDGAGNFYKFNAATQNVDALAFLTYPQGGLILGAKLFLAAYSDGGTEINWVYAVASSATNVFRLMLI